MGGEESVNGVTDGSEPPDQPGEPTCAPTSSAMTASRCAAKAPVTASDGEIVSTSKEELQAAPLNGKRLLALWNALPGVDKRRRVGDREVLSISCGRRLKCCRIASRDPTRKAP